LASPSVVSAFLKTPRNNPGFVTRGGRVLKIPVNQNGMQPFEKIEGVTQSVLGVKAQVTPTTPGILPPLPVLSPILAPECFIPRARCLRDYDLVLGFDTEYNELKFHEFEQMVNDILSYQYTALFKASDGTYNLVENILYTESPLRDDRLSYAEVIYDVLDHFDIGRRRAQGMRILMVSHHGAAEWAALKGREELAIKHLVAVRGIPVTFKDMPVNCYDNHWNKSTVQATWRDTRLLSPQGKGQLADLAETTLHKKLEVSATEKRNMASLLVQDPVRFQAYAIGDTRVTLEYFVQYMETYEREFPDVEGMPLTLGDSGVKAYEAHLEKHPVLTPDIVFGKETRLIINGKGHKQRVKGEVSMRRFTKTLASDAYLGGFNQALMYGKCDVSDSDSIILDVDFSGAYPTTMAVLPVSDWNKTPMVLTDIDAVEHLLATPGIAGRSVPMVLAEANFVFPPDCKYPCLPVMSPYGPLYPLRGTTICTGVELALARRLGAEIKITLGFSFPTLHDEGGNRYLAFADFLGELARRRDEEKLINPGSLRDRMLKEIACSFYGKLSQGLEERTIYNFSGKGEKLKPSRMTSPHYAAMTTGIVRAALCALVDGVSRHEGCRVLSVTTDGAMIVVPRYGAIEVGGDGKVKPPKDAREALGPIYETLLSYYPIRCLEQGRLNLGSDPAWIEIKHVGDVALTAKTRGYYLYHQGKQQHFARAGAQINDPLEWERLYLAEGIETHKGRHLATMKEIMTGKHVDLINVPLKRKVNLDWDFKRMPLLDGSGLTRPPETVDEVYEAREIADAMRKRGQRATPQRVQLVATGMRTQGGTVETIRRTIHQAVAHDLGGWRPRYMKDIEIANRLDITLNAFKNYKRRRPHPQCLADTPEAQATIEDVARRLGLTVTPAMRGVLIAPTPDEKWPVSRPIPPTPLERQARYVEPDDGASAWDDEEPYTQEEIAQMVWECEEEMKQWTSAEWEEYLNEDFDPSDIDPEEMRILAREQEEWDLLMAEDPA